MKNNDADIFKGVVAGMAGGLLASFVMEQFQALWTSAAKALERPGENDERSEAPDKPATIKTADAISKQVVGHKVPKKRQYLAGEAIHYAMGATSAAIYGGLAEIIPVVTSGGGMIFGASVWLLADEGAVPALGFSKPPTQIPISTHAYAFVSHLVYGYVAEAVRSAVRKAL